MTAERGPYFRLGALILTGIALAIGLVWFLGGQRFSHGRLMETYFRESVQGLEIGAPVKYRGVTVGRVTEVGLVNAEYDIGHPARIDDEIYRLVFVRYVVDPAKMGAVPDTAATVKLGLRARLAAQGITGLSYIELDFADPERYPAQEVPWRPKGEYVPSMLSTLGQVQDAAQQVLAKLGKVDFDVLSASLTSLIQDLRDELAAGGGARTALQHISDLFTTLQEAVVASDLPGLTADLRRTSGSVRDVVQGADVRRTLASAAQAADRLARAAESLPPVMAGLQATAKRADSSTADLQQALVPLLRDMQVMAQNLREATEAMRRYPAQVLLGQPPPRGQEQTR